MVVRLKLDVTDPGSHLVQVTQRFPATQDKRRTFRMAAWVPGSYKIRDFGRHVQDMEAKAGGKPARVDQTGKDAWTVQAVAGKAVELTFRVYCRELTVDTSHVTNDHAHLFLATLVLYDDASRRLPHRVTVRKPRGWRLWSGLETEAFDGTLAEADDYDHLIDCPIECGPPAAYTVDTFTSKGRPHRLVWWNAPSDMDRTQVNRSIKKIVETTAKIFGEVPYDHFTFLTHVAMDHGGGLEHRNSTVLGVDPLQLVNKAEIERHLLPLVAHEYFHTWNVKRILPKEFDPYRLQDEVYTGLLWFFEGITTYYELPILARAGVVEQKAWSKFTGELLQYYEMALGRHHRSVADCSRLTWTLLYQAHEHNVNRNVSYYTKGAWIGLCLDAHLREHGVQDGLDVVMRHLWKTHGRPRVGVAEDALPTLIEEATGVDVRAVLRYWAEATTELPIDKAFQYLGFDIKREHKDPEKPIGLGVVFRKGTAAIERIPEDSPAGGILQPEDELVAVEGYKWSGERFASVANTREEGATVSLAAFREGRLRRFDVPLRMLAKDKIKVEPSKGDAAATRRRNAWLNTPWK